MAIGPKKKTHDQRLTELEVDMQGLKGQMAETISGVAELKNNTDEILAVVTGAKSVGGFVVKHGPRVMSFAVGGLTMFGFITADMGQKILALFNLVT